MNDYLKKYRKEFSTRFTKRQKTRFIHELKKDMEALDYEGAIVNGRRGVTTVRNVVFGHLKSAKAVLIVPYDTPAKTLWPKVRYFPLNGNRSNISSILPQYLPVLIPYIIAVVMMNFQDRLFPDPLQQQIFSIVLIFLIFFIFLYLLIGLPNKHNDNRNSASIAAALQFAASLSREEKKKIAFVFTDKNKARHIGAMTAMEDFMKQNKNPNIICLNCIGTGDQMVLGYNRNSRKLAQELNRSRKPKLRQVELDEKMRMQSMMDHFQKAVIIASGEYDSKGDLVVMNTTTGKDRVVKEENLEQVVAILRDYVKTL